ncbi:MAG: hypothetical protein MSC31_19385 [Solirubrobacteraceae bacterium MAG38_C4-C5]|nr:hypothetical protein [Candidatus Siliceabacter maunaloa]
MTYIYEKVNLLETLREPAGTETAFTYDEDNQRVLTVYPNGSSQRVIFNEDSERVETIRSRRSGEMGPVVHELDYSYRQPGCQRGEAERDPCDRDLVQTVTDKERERKTTYTYDLLNRLTDAEITSTNTQQTLENFAYDYDKASNRTRQVHDDQTTTYDYNDNNELTRSDASGLLGSTTYDYDPSGNLTGSSAGFQADYNARGQTTRRRGPQSLIDQALGTDREATFADAGTGQSERTQKNSTLFTDSLFGVASETAAGAAQYYTRDNQGRLISVRTAAGQPLLPDRQHRQRRRAHRRRRRRQRHLSLRALRPDPGHHRRAHPALPLRRGVPRQPDRPLQDRPALLRPATRSVDAAGLPHRLHRPPPRQPLHLRGTGPHQPSGPHRSVLRRRDGHDR